MSSSTLQASSRRADVSAGSTIRVVAACTGISAMTLRAWERRFGFPAPERKPGSDRRVYAWADIERLTLIKRLLAKGFRIGDVVHKSRGELDELAQLGVEGTTRARDETSDAADVAHLVDLLAHDRLVLFEQQVQRTAIAAGPKRFVTQLAHPLAIAIGEAWAEGTISVRHEHFASECLTTFSRQWLAQLQLLTASPAVLLGSLPNEPHTLPIQFVALYLASCGARPVLLGAQTPVEEFVAAAATTRAGAVGLSVSRAGAAAFAKRAITRLRRLLPAPIRLWLGGAGALGLGVGEGTATTITNWESLDRALAALAARPEVSRSARGARASERRRRR